MRFICTGNKDKKEFYSIFNDIYKYFTNLSCEVYLDEFASNKDYKHNIIEDISSTEKKIDFIVSLGGDGSILSAVSRMKNHQIPILGVHIGELGFLNQATKTNYIDVIKDIINTNDIQYQKHNLLKASIFNNDIELSSLFALNDFTINQINYSRLLQIDVNVDGEFLNRYNCDGVIICSPLGSTAYSLSAGGPIVAQDVESLIITPVSPHSLSARPIVVKETSEISLTFPKLKNKIGVYADGQTYKALETNYSVLISRSDISCKLIKTKYLEHYYTKLRKKLNWFGKHRS